MNYRHSFHAGNHADVLKHIALVQLLLAFQRKDKGFLFVDTHAGRGGYTFEASNPGGEWREGIALVIAAAAKDPAGTPEPVKVFLERVRAFSQTVGAFASAEKVTSADSAAPANMLSSGAAETLHGYPGSPCLASALLRQQDRAVFCELQRVEAKALSNELAGWQRAQVREADGYAAVKGLVPPPERRALVLIDPPYEAQAAEFDAVRTTVLDALERFPSCTLAVWYPVKEGAVAQRFLDAMRASGVRRQWVTELCIHQDDSHVGLNGSGLWVVNPPWQFGEALGTTLPWLHRALSPAGRGRWRNTEWVGE
jgi:23S rRNA (adenine2030-N6)-methyltransferase